MISKVVKFVGWLEIFLYYQDNRRTAPRRPHRPPRGGGFSLFLGANAPRQLCQLPLCFFEGKSRTLAPCRQSNKARFMQTALERIKGIEQQGTALQLRGSRQTVYKARFAGSLA